LIDNSFGLGATNQRCHVRVVLLYTCGWDTSFETNSSSCNVLIGMILSIKSVHWFWCLRSDIAINVGRHHISTLLSGQFILWQCVLHVKSYAVGSYIKSWLVWNSCLLNIHFICQFHRIINLFTMHMLGHFGRKYLIWSRHRFVGNIINTKIIRWWATIL
jgi:hypothetical protein